MENRTFWTIDAMKFFGPAFTKQLAILFEVGSREERIVLKLSFRDIFEAYENVGATHEKHMHEPCTCEAADKAEHIKGEHYPHMKNYLNANHDESL